MSIRVGLLALLACTMMATGAPAAPELTMAEILAASPAIDWRPLDPEYTVYMQLPKGRVIIELAPTFAPNHVANVRTLIREGYFDGLAIIRVQDDYVARRPPLSSRSSIDSTMARRRSRHCPTKIPMRRRPALPTASRLPVIQRRTPPG